MKRASVILLLAMVGVLTFTSCGKKKETANAPAAATEDTSDIVIGGDTEES